jgi:phosphoenolpyruvate carboxykinase (GTP)
VDAKKVLQDKLTQDNFDKLMALANDKMHAFVADAIELCNPESVFVVTDSADDIAKIREMAIGNGETKLNTAGHTYHFDGPKDQARDPKNTKYLLPKGVSLGESLNSMDKEEGTAEGGSLKIHMPVSRCWSRFIVLGLRTRSFRSVVLRSRILLM